MLTMMMGLWIVDGIVNGGCFRPQFPPTQGLLSHRQTGSLLSPVLGIGCGETVRSLGRLGPNAQSWDKRA